MSKAREFWIARLPTKAPVERLHVAFKRADFNASIAHPIKCVEATPAALHAEEAIEIMERAFEYLRGSVDCAKACDPSSNFHEPECSIALDFEKLLAKLEEAGE